MSPSLPRRLGRYEVAEVIGTGAFATVYRARDDRLDADVAVKVLAENHSFDPDLRERFISEGQLIRRLDSRHVVTVFDLGETDAGQPFLVLELAGGGDLSNRRRALGGVRPSLDDVLGVARQVAAALGALHAEQVVHRDVAPGNLLIRGPRTVEPATRLLAPGERLMLSDLGLSKDLAARSGLTVGAGTAGFTPPEQGVGGWVDARADIWSASALLVWIALGRPPDRDGRWRDDVRSIGWPEAVVRELERGLAPDPAERHRTAEDWIDALSAAPAAGEPGLVPAGGTRPSDPRAEPAAPAAATEPAAAAEPAEPAGPPGPPEPAPVAGRRPARPRRMVAVAALALALVTGAVASGWRLGRSAAEPAPFGRTRIEHLAGGRDRATVELGSALISVTGPASVPVGRSASYTATTRAVQRWEWLAADGGAYANEPTLVVEPTSEGVTRVRLLGQTTDGKVAVAELPVTVTRGS
ncbi:MAG: serine/threonine protein kinase [Actinobacteria bacterium]|nr:serine/threonine protein kinase [Actinomycetota bacterium]